MKGRIRTQNTGKKMGREANNEKIVCLFFLCTWPTLSVDAVGKDLMTLSGKPSQHDLMTFAFYGSLAVMAQGSTES